MNVQQKTLIDTLLSQGQSYDQIAQVLTMNGMNSQDIDLLFQEYQNQDSTTSQSQPEVSAAPQAAQAMSPQEAQPKIQEMIQPQQSEMPQYPPTDASLTSEPIMGKTPVDTPSVDIVSQVEPVQTPPEAVPSYAEPVPNVAPQTLSKVAGFTGMPKPEEVPPVMQEPSPAVPVTTPSMMQSPQGIPTEQTQSTMGAHQEGVAIPRDPQPEVTPKKSSGKKWLTVFIVIVLLGLVGGGVFAYVQKIGPFALSSYTESNLMSGLASKVATITSADTQGVIRLSAEDREVDAVAFEPIPQDPEVQAQRKRDVERFRVYEIIRSVWTEEYPATLVELYEEAYITDDEKVSFLTDPLTNDRYQYQPTKEGQGFELKITFETEDALNEIRGYEVYDFDAEEYIPGNIQIEGKTVTFTEEYDAWFWFDEGGEQSFVEALSEFAAFLPPELSAEGRMSLASEWGTEDQPEWKFNIGGEGDFGDLTYKVDVDAMKKFNDYFIRINNFPDLFFFGMLPEKGKWFSINTQDDKELLDTFGFNIEELEETYEADRENGQAILREIIRLSDLHKLITFKEVPRRESVGGTNLIRYSLEMNKNGFVPFIQDLQRYVGELDSENPELKAFAEDTEILGFFESESFSHQFDYINKNSSMIMWTDIEGYPVMTEFHYRVIPTGEFVSPQMDTKQVKLVFGMNLRNINQPVDVQAPADAQSLTEYFDNTIFSEAQREGDDALIKGNMMALQAAAELYYGEAQTYGDFGLGACNGSDDSMFAGEDFIYAFEQVRSVVEEGEDIFCIATGSAYAISAPLLEDGQYWCVDSTGFSGEASRHITEVSCEVNPEEIGEETI